MSSREVFYALIIFIILYCIYFCRKESLAGGTDFISAPKQDKVRRRPMMQVYPRDQVAHCGDCKYYWTTGMKY